MQRVRKDFMCLCACILLLLQEIITALMKSFIIFLGALEFFKTQSWRFMLSFETGIVFKLDLHFVELLFSPFGDIHFV